MSAHFARRILAVSVHDWLPRSIIETDTAPCPELQISSPEEIDKTSDSELLLLGASVLILLILVGLLIYVSSRHKYRYLQDKYSGSSSSGGDVESHCHGPKSKCGTSAQSGSKASKVGKQVEEDIQKVDQVADSIIQCERDGLEAMDRRVNRATKKVKEASKEGERKWNQWRGREYPKGKGRGFSKVDERTKLLQKDGAGEEIIGNVVLHGEGCGMDCKAGMRRKSGCVSK